jgi:hypothetical protein
MSDSQDRRMGRDSYRMGAAGANHLGLLQSHPSRLAQTGVKMPCTASAQRGWLAAGNGTRVRSGQENQAT